MKLKAAVSGLHPVLVEKLNKLRQRVLGSILVPYLKVSPTFSSAEFYVQKCDFADDETHTPFCEVRLSGVSVNDERAPNDFRRARRALADVYRDLIATHSKIGTRTDHTTTIMLDAPLHGSTLVEDLPETIEGTLTEEEFAALSCPAEEG